MNPTDTAPLFQPLDTIKRFKRGVKVLDRKYPRWRTVLRKHKDTFDFTDRKYCVLGTLGTHTKLKRQQATRDAFNRALKFLTGDSGSGGAADRPTAPWRYGFDWNGKFASSRGEDKLLLTALWQAEIDPPNNPGQKGVNQ